MIKVHVPFDCGNAPKKQMIVDFNTAFAKGDIDEVFSYMTEGVVWEMTGDKIVEGIAEVEKLLQEMSAYKARELDIFQIITHGKEASVRGVLRFENRQLAFADFYEFSSAGAKKIKRLTSYALYL